MVSTRVPATKHLLVVLTALANSMVREKTTAPGPVRAKRPAARSKGIAHAAENGGQCFKARKA